jgi:hypothetical protein
MAIFISIMGINISAIGKGLPAILGTGAIILAIAGNSAWIIFLIIAVIVFGIQYRLFK